MSVSTRLLFAAAAVFRLEQCNGSRYLEALGSQQARRERTALSRGACDRFARRSADYANADCTQPWNPARLRARPANIGRDRTAIGERFGRGPDTLLAGIGTHDFVGGASAGITDSRREGQGALGFYGRVRPR